MFSKASMSSIPSDHYRCAPPQVARPHFFFAGTHPAVSDLDGTIFQWWNISEGSFTTSKCHPGGEDSPLSKPLDHLGCNSLGKPGIHLVYNAPQASHKVQEAYQITKFFYKTPCCRHILAKLPAWKRYDWRALCLFGAISMRRNLAIHISDVLVFEGKTTEKPVTQIGQSRCLGQQLLWAALLDDFTSFDHEDLLKPGNEQVGQV